MTTNQTIVACAALLLITLSGCSTSKTNDPPINPAYSAPAHPPRAQTTPVKLESLPSCAPIAPDDKKAILALLIRHASAASAMGGGDADGFSDYMDMFHYPTFRVANDKLTVLNTAADVQKEVKHAVDHPFPADYWRSEWTRLLVIDAGPDKIHLATTFNRQRKDGSVIETTTGFYILDKVNGHWGIRGRSSFAPNK